MVYLDALDCLGVQGCEEDLGFEKELVLGWLLQLSRRSWFYAVEFADKVGKLLDFVSGCLEIVDHREAYFGHQDVMELFDQ